jgi:hypothetical protein
VTRAPVPPAGVWHAHRHVIATARRRLAVASLVCVTLVVAVAFPAGAKSKRPSALNGVWRLDPTRTELPARASGAPRAMGGGFGHGGFGGGFGGGVHHGMEGGHGGRGGAGGGAVRGESARPLALPELLRVDADDRAVRLADSTGFTVAEIALAAGSAAAEDTGVTLFDAPHFEGEWKGSKLVVTRELPNGISITDTWTLTGGDHEIEIRSKVKLPGDAPTLEFKRVYVRSAG